MFDFVKANKFFAIILAAVIVVAAALFFILGVKTADKSATEMRYTAAISDRAAVAKAVADATGAPVTAYIVKSVDGEPIELKLVFEDEITAEQAGKADAAVKTVDSAAVRLYKGAASVLTDVDYVALFVSIGIIAVVAFFYGLIRFKKILGVKAAFLLLAVSLLSPLLAAAFVINFRLYAYGGVYFGLSAVSLAASVAAAFAFETVVAGKAAGTASPFSKDAVNASLSGLLYALVLPALAVFAALAIIGLVMLLSGAALAASAAFTIAAAVFSAVFVPVFVAAPMLAKK